MSKTEIKLNTAEIGAFLQSDAVGLCMPFAESVNASAGGTFDIVTADMNALKMGRKTIISIGGTDVDDDDAEALKTACLSIGGQ